MRNQRRKLKSEAGGNLGLCCKLNKFKTVFEPLTCYLPYCNNPKIKQVGKATVERAGQ